jgi:hypothetical protein
MKLDQCVHKRRAPRPLRKLQDYFFVFMNCLGQSFFDHRFEHHRGLMLIEQHKLRIDIGFDRKLVQQTRTQPMDRGDDCAFQRALVTQPRLPFAARFVNVIATMFSTETFLLRRISRKRSTRTNVLPAPGPAVTDKCRSSVCAAIFCSGFSSRA